MTPASSLDPCLSPPDAVVNKLKSYVLGEGNPLDGFLSKGELSQAVQLSLSVLKSANEKNDCGQELDPSVKKLVCSLSQPPHHSRPYLNSCCHRLKVVSVENIRTD